MGQDKLTELMDREAIRDCIYRYCRGIDRADEASLRSSYWPDAEDQHGALASGSVENFIQIVLKIFRSGPRNIHQVSNILIEFDGPNRAAVESYFTALQRASDKNGVVQQMLLCGRYCDVFEKRGDEWRVINRVVVYDWVDDQPAPSASEAERFGPRQPIGAQYPHDQVYKMLSKTVS